VRIRVRVLTRVRTDLAVFIEESGDEAEGVLSLEHLLVGEAYDSSR
jgi:hypothetical protein